VNTRYFCCEDRRRAAIEGRSDLNGIDFLEVLDDPAQSAGDRQRTLFVHFINDPGPLALGIGNVSVRGGELAEYRDPRVTSASIGVDARSGSTRAVLVVVVERAGDFSTYTLTLAPRNAGDTALDAFDPVLRSVDFSFKAACPSPFDCVATSVCAPEGGVEPPIDYLARDFRALRQAMLDRIATLSPGWRDRTPADLGVALVELLAYVGDYLSYRQDAIATEAYLHTARRRTSVRRHARLVDYHMHDGSNARAWLRVRASATVDLPAGTRVISRTPGLPDRLAPTAPEVADATGTGAIVFETMHPLRARAELNDLRFHTWGARECCLPRGATKATLLTHLPDLDVTAGVWLLLEERVDPRTGREADADPRHRHVVRLESVERTVDPIGGLFETPPRNGPVDVTNITWVGDDALPFALCISAELAAESGGGYEPHVGVASGNLVLADHGRRLEPEDLGVVPRPHLVRMAREPEVDADDDGHCRRRDPEAVPPRFRPVLRETSITHAVPFDPTRWPRSARAALDQRPADAQPSLTLSSQRNGVDLQWDPRPDLMRSDATKAHFVAEVEGDGRVSVRFGDGEHGLRPATGEHFHASYRVGTGPEGNVGAGTLAHVVFADAAVVSVTNPLPAVGGVDMETIDEVCHAAPAALRRQDRAVTLEDYAREAGTHPDVQKAAATLRWTGSWHTIFLSTDRRRGLPVSQTFEAELRTFLEGKRLAGHDLEIEPPRFVPLELGMLVDVHPDYSQSDVRGALRDLFGRRGLFNPDNFTFGQTVFLSPLYAAAQSVAGVSRVEITTFQRQDAPGRQGLDDGRLVMGRLEIARLDNDPNFPGRGAATIDVRGGR
jgi:hypothetical protein